MEYVMKESKKIIVTVGQESEKISLKAKIAIMSRVMLEKHSNGDGSDQKSSAIKWKWFI